MSLEEEPIWRELEAFLDGLPPCEQRLVVLLLQKAVEKIQILDEEAFAVWWNDALATVVKLRDLMRHLNS
jgi:hypothetical protein